MKSCISCHQPGVRYPLAIICQWCLQGDVDRAVAAASGKQPQEITVTQPSDIVPRTMTIVTARPKATLTPGGKIVFAGSRAP